MGILQLLSRKGKVHRGVGISLLAATLACHLLALRAGLGAIQLLDDVFEKLLFLPLELSLSALVVFA